MDYMYNSLNEAALNQSHFNNQRMLNYLTLQSQQTGRKMNLEDEMNMMAYYHQLQLHYQQQQLNQLRFMKRRSITASPVRYNFNSKSSPPTTTRIDSSSNLMPGVEYKAENFARIGGYYTAADLAMISQKEREIKLNQLNQIKQRYFLNH